VGLRALACWDCGFESRRLRRADHSSRGVLPNVMCLTECDREASIMMKPWPTRGCCAMENNSPENGLNVGRNVLPYTLKM
jgi:hypothetical protein